MLKDSSPCTAEQPQLEMICFKNIPGIPTERRNVGFPLCQPQASRRGESEHPDYRCRETRRGRRPVIRWSPRFVPVIRCALSARKPKATARERGVVASFRRRQKRGASVRRGATCFVGENMRPAMGNRPIYWALPPHSNSRKGSGPLNHTPKNNNHIQSHSRKFDCNVWSRKRKMIGVVGGLTQKNTNLNIIANQQQPVSSQSLH